MLAGGAVAYASMDIAPMGFKTDIAARAAAGHPILDFFWHDYSSNATHESVLLTFVPNVTVAGAATLELVSAEEAAGGGTSIVSPPVQFDVSAGALLTAEFSVEATQEAGDVIVYMAPLVRLALCLLVHSCRCSVLNNRLRTLRTHWSDCP